MSLKLHFGVIDQPYSYRQQAVSKTGKTLKRMRKVNLSMTTGEVAEHIEDEYSLLESFYTANEDRIIDSLERSLEGALEAVMSGAPVTQDPYGAATSEIEDMLKQSIAGNRLDGRISGVPTAASGRVPSVRKGGINHRLAHPYSQDNPARPSFVDTGMFQSSLKVWVE